MTRLIKNIICGAGTIFTISPPKRKPRAKRLYNPHKSAKSALKSDWQKIGGDFKKVFGQVAHAEE